MKTKLIARPDLEPKTQQDCWKLLVDGFVLKDKHNDVKLRFINGTLHWAWENAVPCTDISFVDPSQWEVLEEKEAKWYENIPEKGVFCWVDDFDSAPTGRGIVLITTYFEDTEYPYIDKSEVGWKFAKPLTKEEAKEYVFDGED